MSMFQQWMALSACVYLLPYLISGIRIDHAAAAIASGAILTVLQRFVRPILFFLTLPFTILTLGLFMFVLNGMLLYAAAGLVEGFYIPSFWSAVFASLFISLVSMILENQNGSSAKIFATQKSRQQKYQGDGAINLKEVSKNHWE